MFSHRNKALCSLLVVAWLNSSSLLQPVLNIAPHGTEDVRFSIELLFEGWHIQSPSRFQQLAFELISRDRRAGFCTGPLRAHMRGIQYTRCISWCWSSRRHSAYPTLIGFGVTDFLRWNEQRIFLRWTSYHWGVTRTRNRSCPGAGKTDNQKLLHLRWDRQTIWVKRLKSLVAVVGNEPSQR